jgi:hyperosmotically inducible periplasmic protein
MSGKLTSLRRFAVAWCVFASVGTVPTLIHAQNQTPSATAPDNSAQNKSHATTADQQMNDRSDRGITRQIRRSIVSDKSISTYGHNVKIITQNGSVTLKGPVHSEEEKQAIAAKAAQVAGQDKVTNELTVKQ